MIYDIAVIGAGACGIFSILKSSSKNILVFDKKSGAKKLAMTGNNRCNITNDLGKELFLQQYGQNGNFLRDAFNIFFKSDLISFLKTLGFETYKEKTRIILKNSNSEKFAHTLLEKAKQKAKIFKQNEPVTDIKKVGRIFEIQTDKGIYKALFVIMACGGKSYPQTGSDGSCYAIAKRLGHSIIKTEPYEVPFCVENLPNLQGLSFSNVGLTLKIGKKHINTDGDIIFTHFGISGPAVLYLSNRNFDKAELYINFLKTDRDDFKQKLLSHNGKVKNFLKKYLPNRFVNEIINIEKNTKELSKKDINFILGTLLSFRLDIKKCSFNKAFVTKGGISTRDINPKTMESKIVENLFFCGEVIDIQGSIGGFNLQAAFSTAFCAINSINKKLQTHTL